MSEKKRIREQYGSNSRAFTHSSPAESFLPSKELPSLAKPVSIGSVSHHAYLHSSVSPSFVSSLVLRYATTASATSVTAAVTTATTITDDS
jgi:hypothetical protein